MIVNSHPLPIISIFCDVSYQLSGTMFQWYWYLIQSDLTSYGYFSIWEYAFRFFIPLIWFIGCLSIEWMNMSMKGCITLITVVGEIEAKWIWKWNQKTLFYTQWSPCSLSSLSCVDLIFFLLCNDVIWLTVYPSCLSLDLFLYLVSGCRDTDL